MKLNGSHLVALAIMAGIGGWMFTGQLILGGQADPNAETIAEREAERTTKAFRVRVVSVQPSDRVERLAIRGRTQASATISVRAETGGTIRQRLVSKGQMVKSGDLLCVIDQGVRGTGLAQAQAQLEQAQADYDANSRLVERGFATRTRLRQLKAALDAAKAAVATANQEITRTEIRATASGMVEAPLAEVGDNLAAGQVCVTLVQSDPMLFTGQVPERNVTDVKLGMEAKVGLVTGEVVAGKVKFISPVADAQTRTFRMEVEVPNADRTILDGMTATAQINLSPVSAYRVKPSWLTLADDGQVGVRAVNAENKVTFVPVTILAQDASGMWVNGLTPGLSVITLGQDYVAAGETVDPVAEEAASATSGGEDVKTSSSKQAEIKS